MVSCKTVKKLIRLNFLSKQFIIFNLNQMGMFSLIHYNFLRKNIIYCFFPGLLHDRPQLQLLRTFLQRVTFSRIPIPLQGVHILQGVHLFQRAHLLKEVQLPPQTQLRRLRSACNLINRCAELECCPLLLCC